MKVRATRFLTWTTSAAGLTRWLPTVHPDPPLPALLDRHLQALVVVLPDLRLVVRVKATALQDPPVEAPVDPRQQADQPVPVEVLRLLLQVPRLGVLLARHRDPLPFPGHTRHPEVLLPPLRLPPPLVPLPRLADPLAAALQEVRVVVLQPHRLDLLHFLDLIHRQVHPLFLVHIVLQVHLVHLHQLRLQLVHLQVHREALQPAQVHLF